jgi:tRNA dimethylallyltransferase
VALVGTTASGKSAVAEAAARARPGVELVSVDSMTVYRHLDKGTAKPIPAERQAVPHHLLDLVEPSEECTVSRFQRAALDVLDDLARRGARPLLVGGTGLYLRAVVDRLGFPGRFPEVAAALEEEAAQQGGVARLHARLSALDPVAASRMEPTNHRRVVRALEVTLGAARPFSSFGPGLERYPETETILLGLTFDPVAVDRRIEERFEAFLAAGLVDEVAALAARRPPLSRTARQALGYKELLEHVEHGRPLEACVAEAVRRTRSFARRQWAWFRRDPRITWLDDHDDPVAAVLDALDAAAATPQRLAMAR